MNGWIMKMPTWLTSLHIFADFLDFLWWHLIQNGKLLLFIIHIVIVIYIHTDDAISTDLYVRLPVGTFVMKLRGSPDEFLLKGLPEG